MKVYSKASNSPVKLGILVECSVVSISHADYRFRNDFYMNDNGQIVWDMFHLSRSTTEPVASITYDIVKE